MASMVYLALLAALGGLFSKNSFENWRIVTSDLITLQIPEPEVKVEKSKGTTRVVEVLRVLRTIPSIKNINILEMEDIRNLVNPWIEAEALGNIPLPALIEIKIKNKTVLAKLKQSLPKIVPGIVFEDHKKLFSTGLKSLQSIEQVFLIIFILVTTVAIVSVVFVVLAGLSINKEVIAVMHLIGAENSFIAKKFQKHIFIISAVATAIGAFLAFISVIAMEKWLWLAFFGVSEGNLFAQFKLLDWVLLASIPLLYPIIAISVAGISVLVVLEKTN